MTARPFSRIEPLSVPDDPARRIAGFFALMSGAAVLPGVLGVVVMFLMFAKSAGDGEFLAAGAFLGGLAYTVLGFAQFVFYLRRAVGESKRSARVWWLSTYFFNLVPVGVAIAVFVQDPYAAPALAAVWFAGLCTLAVVAYASELRRA